MFVEELDEFELREVECGGVVEQLVVSAEGLEGGEQGKLMSVVTVHS